MHVNLGMFSYIWSLYLSCKVIFLQHVLVNVVGFRWRFCLRRRLNVGGVTLKEAYCECDNFVMTRSKWAIMWWLMPNLPARSCNSRDLRY